MIIKGFTYIPFYLNFKTPFQTSSKTIKKRNGIIIKLFDELGNTALGECSPLPGFSTDTIDEANKLLVSLQDKMIGLNVEHFPDSILESLKEFNLTPSLQFALEQAIISLIILREKNFLNYFIPEQYFLIGINAVIGIEKENVILARIREKIKLGFDTFKIKVGRKYINEDFILIKNIRDEFGSAIEIRLDANRSWSSDEALGNISLFKDYNITCIEEPCEFACDNFKLIEESPVPIALDESLISFGHALELINSCNAKFIILKPMILGGIISSYNLIKEAENRNKKVIISSSFESAVGRSPLVLLAAATGNMIAQGLDTSEYFERDICTDPFKVTKGKISFTADNYPPQFDFGHL